MFALEFLLFIRKWWKQQQKWRNDIISSANVYPPSKSYLKYYTKVTYKICRCLSCQTTSKMSKDDKLHVNKKKTHNTLRKKKYPLTCQNSIAIKIFWEHIPSCVSSCVWKFASNCISRSSILYIWISISIYKKKKKKNSLRKF